MNFCNATLKATFRKITACASDLLDLLLNRGDQQAIEHLAKLYEQAGLLHMALWFRARVINQQEDWSELESIGQQLLENKRA